jgi:hypothetical protein
MRCLTSINSNFKAMKTTLKFSLAISFCAIAFSSFGQEIRTLIGSNNVRASGGYGALTNKFTTIKGQNANMVGIYAGWYINHKFTLGVSGAAVTNNIEVPEAYSAIPGEKMSYEYGQCGLLTEYVIGSNRVFHIGIQLFSGAGFTTQYQRYNWDDEHDSFDETNANDTNWFVVTEPGVNIEVNVFKWMRFCPGISYRAAFGSEGLGMKDKDINGTSLNLSLKFGKF